MSGRTPEEGRYSRITRRMWNDEKFQNLSKAKPNGQTLWTRALSGPELGVIPGLFAAREGGLADHLGWPLAAFRKCWKEITDQEMAEADWRAGLVWVPNAIVHNEPNSTNAILGWRTPMRELPECPLKQKAIAALRAYCETKGPLWVKAFDAACQDQKQSTPSATPSGTPSPVPSISASDTPLRRPSRTASATPSGVASATPFGTPSCIQDQDQDTRSRSSAAEDLSEDLTGFPRERPSSETAAAADSGVMPKLNEATLPLIAVTDLTRKYELAQKNPGAFALEGGVRWPEFLAVWHAWCRPFGITEPPSITQRIDRDILTIVEAFASGKTLEQLLAAGKAAETDDYFKGLTGGGPASFTPAVLRRLLAPPRAIAAGSRRRGGPPQPDHGKTGWEGQE